MVEPQSAILQEIRPPIFPTTSFAGTPSPSVTRTSLKRSITTDLDFLTPAAESFRPRPYSPARASCSTSTRHRYNNLTRNQSRTSVASPPLALDVSEKDPGVIILHPPFNDFPGADTYAEGLTYSLMANNPEWFLDSTDYHPLEGPVPSNAIPYPTCLEPPRGWCPTKKKESGDGWADGEEPKLRCTFCRRSYAGVNAKSMWRRHVFEKHKVGMSNRREGERPRGRGSMKENRRPHRVREEHDSIVGIEVAPQANARNTTFKSRFQIGRMLETTTEPTSVSPPELSSGSDDSVSPPSTPPPVFSDPERSQLVSFSPYDPSQTPAFRHSSPRLPSDQPWRFPSPAHPLHSRQRQVSLSQLIHTPGAKTHVSTDSPGPLISSKLLHPSPLKSMMLPPSSPLLTPATSPHFRSADNDAFISDGDDIDVADKWTASTSSPFRLGLHPTASPLATLVGDSPVLRSKSIPSGLGLLEPISLVDKKILAPRWDEDDDVEFDESSYVIYSPAPPPKRRKLTSL